MTCHRVYSRWLKSTTNDIIFSNIIRVSHVEGLLACFATVCTLFARCYDFGVRRSRGMAWHVDFVRRQLKAYFVYSSAIAVVEKIDVLSFFFSLRRHVNRKV